MVLRTVECWQMREAGEPFVRATREVELGPDQVLVQVAGCGVCHTDLSFASGSVRTSRPPPITLGHEVAGEVVEAGPAMGHLKGAAVVIPAVLPCGDCVLCTTGLAPICRSQVFLGSDVDGGFASHVVVPGRHLAVVDRARLEPSGLALADLGVVADAVSTPYQAILRSGLSRGELAVVVGVGGVGGFAVQLAAAQGAHVVAIDLDPERLRLALAHGAELALDAGGLDRKALRQAVLDHAEARGLPRYGYKIFETSGHVAGQELAYSLLSYGGYLGVVGFSPRNISIRLGNLMAFHATAQGNWGCAPEHYPAILDLVLAGQIQLAPFIEQRPMSAINQVFLALANGELRKRPVLIPDFN